MDYPLVKDHHSNPSELRNNSLNPLLKEQFDRYFDEEDLDVHPGLRKLLQAVNQTYDQLLNPPGDLRGDGDRYSFSQDPISLTRRPESRREIDNVTKKPGSEAVNEKLRSIVNRLSYQISQRRDAEKKFRESESNISALIENTNDLICLVDHHGHLITFNSAFEGFFHQNYQKVPEVEMNFIDLVPEDKQEFWIDQFTRALIGDRFCVGIEKKNEGEIRYFEAFFNPVYYDGENIKGVSIFMRDITDRRRIEQNLEASEERYRHSFENNMMGMVSLDSNTNLTAVNKAFCEWLGYDEEELLAMKLSDLGESEDTLEQSKKYLEQLQRKEITHFVIEKKYRKKDGSVVEGKVFVVGSFDEEGRFEETWATVLDVTATKAYEKNLNKLVDDLTMANSELKRFAHIVSHDLKAPLRAIGSLAQWLHEDNYENLEDESRKQLKLLKGRVSRLYNQIEGILEYSRISQLDKKEEVDLNAVLEDEVLYFITLNQGVEIHLDNVLPQINISKMRMVQVFQNLISNAIKFTDKPEGIIHIGSMEEDDHWKFYIRDNGMGIKEKHYDRIFVLFQTLMPRDKMENTGIGLAIVKKIIQQYGGKVWVESKVGEGSTFWFSLPKTRLQSV